MTTLTKSAKQHIVANILRDIPKIDYAKQVQELKQLDAYNKMPEAVKKVFDDKETRHYLYLIHDHEYVIGSFPYYGSRDYQPSLETRNKVESLLDLAREQRNKLQLIENELIALFQGVTTVGKARKQFPEFAKYLPDDNIVAGVDPTKALSTTQLITRLEDLGWKKDSVEKS